SPERIHECDLSGDMTMLHTVANGRAYLGLVRGAWLDSLGIEDKRPIQRMRETVGVIRHLLSGGESGYDAQIFKLPTGRLFQYPVLRPDIPILLGTWGPKLLQYAGEVANEVKIGGSTNPALVAEVRRNLAIGEAKAGRPI